MYPHGPIGSSLPDGAGPQQIAPTVTFGTVAILNHIIRKSMLAPDLAPRSFPS
jgi:hypothetical protein